LKIDLHAVALLRLLSLDIPVTGLQEEHGGDDGITAFAFGGSPIQHVVQRAALGFAALI